MENIKIDKLVKTSRKTISLIIDKEGKLTVRAPRFLNNQDINTFVKKKSNWILQKQRDIREKIANLTTRKYIDGEKIMYMGEEYSLIIRKDFDKVLLFDGKAFILNESRRPYAKEIFKMWFKINSKPYIYKRVLYFAEKYGFKFNDIKISNADKRWGSCSTGKNLNFSWRLIMTPPEIIDYIVVHELAHLSELNHSYRFWNIVERIIPDYKIKEQWLNENDRYFVL